MTMGIVPTITKIESRQSGDRRACALNTPATKPRMTRQMSRQKYRIAATMAPTWMIAVNAVGPGPEMSMCSSFSAIVRWPVELIGRNSVSPSTMPRTIAFHSASGTDLLPHSGLVECFGRRAQRTDTVVDIADEQRNGQCGHSSGGVVAHARSDPVHGAEQARPIDEFHRNRGGRFLLPFREIEILNLARGIAVPHPNGESVVEVLLAASHAADVERRVPPHERRTRIDIVADHERHTRYDIKSVERAAGLRPPGADRRECLVGELRR